MSPAGWNLPAAQHVWERMSNHLCAAAAALLLLGGCGIPAPGERAQSTPDRGRSDSQPTGLYEANATVLDDGKSGPMLCLGGMLESLPPQCGDVPVAGWDWADVEGEERAGGVTWGGDYHVVGTFDGQRFELTEPPGPPAPHLDPPDHFSSEPACDEPTGGWITEGDGIDQSAAGRILGSLENHPEYAAGWITQLAPADDETDTGPVVLNAAFTGHVAGHEARLRERWPGSLCVVLYERSLEDLQRIQQEAGEMAHEMGSQNLHSGIDVTRNLVELHVVHLPERTRAKLEERFGPDALRLSAALLPVTE